MPEMPETPQATDLAALGAAQDGLAAALSGLDDSAARGPSRLPGWSRGHVLTHLARNADGMRNLVHWAVTGEPTPMYPSPEARAADIEAGSARSAAELVADVAASGARLLGELAALPAPALAAVVELGPSRTATPAADLAGHRLREVLVHHVDLDLGYEPGDWPRAFGVRNLDHLVPRTAARSPLPVSALVAVDGTERWPGGPAQGLELTGTPQALLGWLVGRIAPADAGRAGLHVSDGSIGITVPAPPPWG